MIKSSQNQETNKHGFQKKAQEVAQEVSKAWKDQIIKENRLNRKNQIELESSDSLTEYQKEERREFIRYLQRDFFKKRHSDKTAEDLVLSEYSFQFQALNPEIQTFMNDVITGNIQISSSEDYSAKIKNLLEKINNEVFLSSELPKVDNSQSWAPTNLYQEMSGPRILQNSMPLQGYIDDFTNMLKTGFNGILNNHQAEAEVEFEAEGYSNDIQCRIEYCQIEIEELKPFLINFLDSFTGKEISLPRKGMDKYSPVERVHVNDKFGLWTYDPLQGCIDISFRSADGGPLQKKITLEKNFFKNNPRSVVTIQRQYEPTEESKRNDSDMSLEDFLKKVVEINGKERKSVQEWINKLNLNDVHRLEEIFAWVDDDWKQASLSVGAKKLIQTHLNQFRVNTDKSQEAHELTKAEKYAVVHRIKRFLIWKTHPKELKNVPYIDKRALEAGFQEIKKKYAGHDLLSELERFYKCLRSRSLTAKV